MSVFTKPGLELNAESVSTQALDHFSEFLGIPVSKLDADQYSAEDVDGVTESVFGSGNLNFMMLQSGQTNELLVMNTASPFQQASSTSAHSGAGVLLKPAAMVPSMSGDQLGNTFKADGSIFSGSAPITPLYSGGNAGTYSPWNIAGNALAPLLNFGRIQSRIEAANAREVQAYHTYRQAVLTGLSDVDNALASYLNEQRRLEALRIAASDQIKSLHIATEQYKAGTITQLDLLVAEQNRLNADVSLAQSQGQVAENLVLLYRAMGWGAQADTGTAQEIPQMEPEVAAVLQNAVRMQPIIE